MEPRPSLDLGPVDYFGDVHTAQEEVEFTVRNINEIREHTRPIPSNLYSFVRGRDIFGRVENYREFLEAVREIVQPDGVVEFIEIDPRPRVQAPRRKTNSDDHTSGPLEMTDDTIESRFIKPFDGD